MYNVAMIRFEQYQDEYGMLVPIEARIHVPFEIKRVYYITRVPLTQRRGFHSHEKLHQVLICVHGSLKVQVQNGTETEVYTLKDEREGLYIGPKVWREMFDFSQGAVLLVLASEPYEKADYVRDYQHYLESAQRYFAQEERAPKADPGEEDGRA